LDAKHGRSTAWRRYQRWTVWLEGETGRTGRLRLRRLGDELPLSGPARRFIRRGSPGSDEVHLSSLIRYLSPVCTLHARLPRFTYRAERSQKLGAKHAPYNPPVSHSVMLHLVPNVTKDGEVRRKSVAPALRPRGYPRGVQGLYGKRISVQLRMVKQRVVRLRKGRASKGERACHGRRRQAYRYMVKRQMNPGPQSPENPLIFFVILITVRASAAHEKCALRKRPLRSYFFLLIGLTKS
jgi:hypothetical protein